MESIDYSCCHLKMKKNGTSFLNYYTPEVEIKDFNALIDGKRYFDVPIKSKKEAYENIIEMSKN